MKSILLTVAVLICPLGVTTKASDDGYSTNDQFMHVNALARLEALQREALAEASTALLHKFEDDITPFKLSAKDETQIRNVNEEHGTTLAEAPSKVRSLWKLRIAEQLLWTTIEQYRALIGAEHYVDDTLPTDDASTVRVKHMHLDVLSQYNNLAIGLFEARIDPLMEHIWPKIREVRFEHADNFLDEQLATVAALSETIENRDGTSTTSID